jgi:DNA-binding IclR family transcriptional regulator
MPMRTAVLAMLVSADAGLDAQHIARNYNLNIGDVRQYLEQLADHGYVKRKDALYYHTARGERAATLQGIQRAPSD